MPAPAYKADKSRAKADYWTTPIFTTGGGSETPACPTPIDAKLLRAELVADHWRKAALAWGDDWISAQVFAHGLCCVLAALLGDTSDPVQLGVEPASEEGLLLSALVPADDARTRP